MEERKKTAREIIEGYQGPPVRIMEVCGTHTHEIFRLGIRKLLPPQVELISGPGCPVCVTPVGQVVFLSVGFETTTPAGCLSVKKAGEDGLSNYSLLVANKTMPQAYQALKGSADVFLYPGHVNAITGTALCEQLAEEGISGVVAGFTAKELLTALAVALVRFQEGKPFFVNCYPRVVKSEGSPEAQKLIDELMEPCDSEWRGLGVIPGSGLVLRKEWEAFDARKKYAVPPIQGRPNPACRCGDVLQGKCRPSDCKVFGKVCTPQHPVGACMVSNEGACSAYFMYGN